MAAKKRKQAKLGTGERFKKLVKSGMSRALAAFVGRKRHGKKKMAALSARGRKRRSK